MHNSRRSVRISSTAIVLACLAALSAIASTTTPAAKALDQVREYFGIGASTSALGRTASEGQTGSPTSIEAQPMFFTASDAPPILYYDFEDNTSRTTFENAVEQAVIPSGILTLNNIVGGNGDTGAGTFNGGAADGQAIKATNWSADTTDPGTAAANWYQFTTGTTGFSGISVTLDDSAGNRGPARIGLMYSTDGTNFTAVSPVLTGDTVFTTVTFDLTGVSALNNQNLIFFRLYGFAGSASDRVGRFGFTSGGYLLIDNLTVRANTLTGTKTLLDYDAIGLSIKSGTAYLPSYGAFTISSSGNATLASDISTSGTFTNNGTLTCGTNIISGTGAFTLGSGATLGIGDVGGITASSASGNIQVTGTRTFGSGANYTYNGSAAQGTGNGFPATVNNLTINNPAGVTLNGPTSIAGKLTLTSGNLISTNANLPTITNTAVGGLSGGSASSYVQGPLARVIPSSSSTYLFPVGAGGYNPFETVNSGAGNPTLRVSVFDSGTGGTPGTGLGSLKTNHYWQARYLDSNQFSSIAIRLTDSTLSATDRIGRYINNSNNNAGGTYDSVGGTVSGSTITSPLMSTVGFFVIGTPGPPTLGNYSNKSVGLSGNTTVTPSAAPADTTSINVSTTSAFKGTLAANTSTGVVRVTNAHPAGTYPVTVTAFGNGGSSSQTFNLTVTNGSACGVPSGFSLATAANVSIGAVTVPIGVAVGDLNGDGKQDIITANNGSHDLSVALGDGAGGFGAATTLAAAASGFPTPIAVAIGDINGDGKQDLIAANYGTANVAWRLGNGDGTFAGINNRSVGTNPYSIVLADFNGDGKLDFATANYGANTVSVSLGDGAGAFAAATTFSVGSAPSSIAVGDFNGDGKVDLATANSGSNNMSILIGNGSGSFASAVNYAAGFVPVAVAVGDVNGDGNQDLAVANGSGSTGVSVLIGNGAGGFGSPTTFAGGAKPVAVAFADLNNDGKADIVAADQNGDAVSVHIGDGAGNFEYRRLYGVGDAPASAVVADLNGDGRQDVVGANSISNNVSVLLGTCITPEVNVKGNGVSIADGDTTPSAADDTNFGTTQVLTPVTHTFTIENTGTGDLYLTQANPPSITGANADQFQVFVPPATNVIAGSSSTTFQIRFYPDSPGLKTATISFGNNDSDENPYDFAIQGIAGASYTLTYNGNSNTSGSAPIDPNSPYAAGSTVTVLGNTGGLARTNYTFGGWNTQADGQGTTYQAGNTFSISGVTTLYAVWTPNTPTLGSYANSSIVISDNGSITPSAAPAYTTALTARSTTDFRGTLTADPSTGAVRVTNAYPAGTFPVTVTAYGATGPATATFNLTVTETACGGTSGFGATANFGSGTTPGGVAVGDFDGDGNQDLVTANSGSANLSLLKGDGAGSFASAVNFAVGTSPQGIAVGDLNGDGKPDIVTANNGSNNVSMLLGNGAGSFAAKVDIGVTGTPYSIAIADLNGDGKQDIVTANTSGFYSVLLGNGAGGFTVTNSAIAGTAPVSIAVGDFNGDGKQDLVVAHSTAGYVTIMPGNGDGTFGVFTTYSSGAFSVSVAVGDVNGDGKQDLAVANSSANTISVLIGDGSGGFSAAVPFAVGSAPVSVGIADFNGDGKLDLISANNGSANVSVLTGDGSGGFAAAVDYAVGSGAMSVAVGDFDGDGKQDFASSNSSANNVSVRLGTCTPAPTIAFSSSSFTDDESQTAIVTVTRSGDTSGSASVQYATSDGTATGGVSCAVGKDYVAASGTLNFVAGDTSKTFSVQLCPDSIFEASETTDLTLSNVTGAGTTLGSPSTAVLNINDTATDAQNMTPITVDSTSHSSSIAVSSGPASVSSMRVTLYDVEITPADDLDVVLVGPNGEKFLLMGDAGGATGLDSAPTLTFNDYATPYLPDSTVIATSNYKPTSWEANQSSFPSPGPTAPFREPGHASGGDTFATAFGNSNAVGTWTLYVRKDGGQPVAEAADTIGGWGIQFFAPSGAEVEVAGRVITAEGQGIYDARVLVTSTVTGAQFQTITGPFGYFNVAGLEAGETYVVNVSSKRFTFANPNKVLTLNENAEDLLFTANPSQ